jgi:hypothetical protein
VASADAARKDDAMPKFDKTAQTESQLRDRMAPRKDDMMSIAHPRRMITPMTFDQLLARRAELRASHTDWCSEVNGPLGTGEGSLEAQGRDRAYRELCEVEATIEAELEAERRLEEEPNP